MIIGNWNVKETRYPNLGYLKVDKYCWRFVDLQEYREEGKRDYPHGAPCVGLKYRTRTELLADLERYANVWGY